MNTEEYFKRLHHLAALQKKRNEEKAPHKKDADTKNSNHDF